MRFYQLRNRLLSQLILPLRVQMVGLWYLLSLMVETRKHSLHFAAALSGLNPSQCSKFLRKHHRIAAYTLADLSRRQAKQLGPVLTEFQGLPWKIAILIDATLQTRAGLHTENSHRFNHGHGFVMGHQWTNIVLLRNGILIPLPPIAFYSKNYCRPVLKIPYQTEHQRLIEYLKTLELEAYIGAYDPEQVVVIADSGYDDHAIQQTIRSKQWHFLVALKSRRSVKSPAQYRTTRNARGWTQIAQFFKNHRRLSWNTIAVPAPRTRKKRMEFRVRQTIGYLKKVGQVQLVCSECKQRRKGRRKYLACSDLRLTPKQIILGYRLRWRIDIFHKQIKQHLGFEDVSPQSFRSVETHVYLVYCAYILLHSGLAGVPDDARTIPDKQAYIQAILEKRALARILQTLTQFGGVEKYMNELKAVLASI